MATYINHWARFSVFSKSKKEIQISDISTSHNYLTVIELVERDEKVEQVRSQWVEKTSERSWET